MNREPLIIAASIAEFQRLEAQRVPTIDPRDVASTLQNNFPDIEPHDLLEAVKKASRFHYQGIPLNRVQVDLHRLYGSERERAFKVWLRNVVARAGTMSSAEVIAEGERSGLQETEWEILAHELQEAGRRYHGEADALRSEVECRGE